MLKLEIDNAAKLQAVKEHNFEEVFRILKEVGLYPVMESEVIDVQGAVCYWRTGAGQSAAATPAFKIGADGTVYVVMYNDLEYARDEWTRSIILRYPGHVRSRLKKMMRPVSGTGKRVRFVTHESVK